MFKSVLNNQEKSQEKLTFIKVQHLSRKTRKVAVIFLHFFAVQQQATK